MSDVTPPTDVEGAAADDSGGRIEPIEIQEEMERSFLDYSMSVITRGRCPTRVTASSRCTAGSSGTCTTWAPAPTGPRSSAPASPAT